jgi:hypothetical protein
MRVYLSIILVSFFAFQNCERTQLLENESFIEGRWIEINPIANRLELIFQSENQLIQKQNTNEAQATFTYEILEDSISLSTNEADVSEPIIVFFAIDENDQLSIGNFTSLENTDKIIQMRKIE